VRPTRREVLIGAALLAAVPARAQAGPKLLCAMIGAASATDVNGAAWFAAIRDGLAAEGWTDGGNVHIEARYTAGLAALSEGYAGELAALGPDIWLCGTSANARNAHERLPDVSLVFVAVPDPIGDGLVRSFNAPGGNVTGVAHFEPSVGGKQMGLLLDIVPSVRNVGLIYNPDAGNSTTLLRPYILEVANAAGVTVIDLPVRTLDEVEPAIASIAALPDPGLFVPTNNWINSNRQFFIDLVAKYRLPAIWGHTGVDAALMSYRAHTTEAFHLAGGLAGRILNGARPADTPVLGAPRYILTVNLKVAAELGLTVPMSILVGADVIIE
jgi:putative ABC transport system substrate-binding protein